ncbi:hypothetical protein MRB53_041485 [Persea americana]|nr:hypothetical protein MRB53_041485 [Persea americana]
MPDARSRREVQERCRQEGYGYLTSRAVGKVVGRYARREGTASRFSGGVGGDRLMRHMSLAMRLVCGPPATLQYSNITVTDVSTPWELIGQHEGGGVDSTAGDRPADTHHAPTQTRTSADMHIRRHAHTQTCTYAHTRTQWWHLPDVSCRVGCCE